jgi:hypothetical protein
MEGPVTPSINEKPDVGPRAIRSRIQEIDDQIQSEEMFMSQAADEKWQYELSRARIAGLKHERTLLQTALGDL